MFKVVGSLGVRLVSICGLILGLCVFAAAVNWMVKAFDGSTVHVTRHKNGTIQSITPRDSNGAIHGTYKEFADDGRLVEESEVSHGQPTRYRMYWPSGRLRTEEREGPGFTMVSESYPDED